MDKLISVIMPCYNEEKTIKAAIYSILEQTYPGFELIVVDDCSTDESGRIIKGIAEKDERLRYIKNNHNSGVAVSLNNGIRNATGKYIARMDSDDICERSRFEKQIEYLENNPDCILCASLADVDNGQEKRVQGNIDFDITKALVRNNPIVHSSVMFPRIINGRVIFYPETKGFEDYGLWIKLVSLGKFHVIPEVLVHRFDYNNRETKKTWEGFTKQKVYKKLLHYQFNAARATGHWVLGMRYCSITAMKILYSYFDATFTR